jgi:hypothetical protein
MRWPEPDTDETVRVLPRSRGRHIPWVIVGTILVGVALAGSVTVWLSRPSSVPQAVSTTPAPDVVTPAFRIATATEDEIARHVPTELTVFRFADNERILVLDFASLHEQGEMLNRMAAFVEKAGLPHDRVLSDAELDAAIRAKGDTVETFYFGHDYAASALQRFFALADTQRIRLNAQEEALRALTHQEGWSAPDAAAGLISLPAVGSDPRITATARAAILRHELSHGEFFSNPAYAAFVRDFWMRDLTGEERGLVRGYLGSEGYDVREEELMYNEMQAYLMFTRDPLFFTPDMVGMSRARLAELQRRFGAGMPAGWLRDLLVRQ